jgi:ABC-type antimicrobial peptide transport system permease subunit
MDPEVPLATVSELSEAVRRALAPSRFTAALLVGFSGFAVLLAVLGLYGVMAYAGRQDRREVAIRMALGADRSRVTGHYLRHGLVMVATGVALGSSGGLLLARALEGQLHGVSAFDVPTHVSVAVGLLATATLAVWLPARQASGAAPMGVLREE